MKKVLTLMDVITTCRKNWFQLKVTLAKVNFKVTFNLLALI